MTKTNSPRRTANIDLAVIQKAIQILRDGGIVALPTETVYGLGADATKASAIQKIFEAKGRPSTNPLIVHVADIMTARKYASAWPIAAEKLATAFWPGPLTLVLLKSPIIVDAVTAGRGSVGLRVPNHPLTLELLRAFDGAVAAPSANRANHISPTSAADVKAELGDRVDLILDGGPCVVGIESTVLDLTGHHPKILRPGRVSREEIENVIGPVDVFTGSVDASTAAPSPGQQARHYSPQSPTYWFDRSQRSAILSRGVGMVLIVGDQIASQTNVVSMPDDAPTYARILYQSLREIDLKLPTGIYVELPPDEPQWVAVRDRLLRAAVQLKD